MKTIRITTYNIHKCVGLDRRFAPERIVEVLKETDADIISLQEVLCHSNSNEREHQAKFIANQLNMTYTFGKNRQIKGGDYGNAILSRFEIEESENFDISIKRREPRGCLRTKISFSRFTSIELYNLHLGTSFFERRKQAGQILEKGIIRNSSENRIFTGDFNEWTKGKTTRLFQKNFNGLKPKIHLGKRKTYPGILPLLHLDHIYFDSEFNLQNAFLHRSRTALIASDHLPIVAEFQLKNLVEP